MYKVQVEFFGSWIDMVPSREHGDVTIIGQMEMSKADAESFKRALSQGNDRTYRVVPA